MSTERWTIEFCGIPGRDPYANNARVIGPPVVCNGVNEPDEPVDVVPARLLDAVRLDLISALGQAQEHEAECQRLRDALERIAHDTHPVRGKESPTTVAMRRIARDALSVTTRKETP